MKIKLADIIRLCMFVFMITFASFQIEFVGYSLLIGLVLAGAGSILNTLALVFNNRKMPVYLPKKDRLIPEKKETKNHKIYSSRRGIKLFGLVDRFNFYWQFKKRMHGISFSVGDMLVIPGAFILIFNFGLAIGKFLL